MSSNEAGTSVRTSGVGMSDRAAGQSKFTPDRTEAVLAALRSGKTLVQAAEAAGVYKETLATWRLRHPWFDEAVRDAIAGGLRRVSHEVVDACVAAMRSGATGATAASALGFTYTGVCRWATENGREEEFRAAVDAAEDRRKAARPLKAPKRRPVGVHKVNARMTDDVIAAIADRVRRGEPSEEAAAAELGRRMSKYFAWRKAYPDRAKPIADAVEWVRGIAPRARTEELLEPLSRRAMLDAVERGRGWNGIAKAAGMHAGALQKWCRPPFHSAEHEAFVGELMAAWERERTERAASVSGRVTAKRARRDKDLRLKREYGITLLQAEAMQARQRGGCAICGTKLRPIGEVHDSKSDGSIKPVVDHCHDTGKVRGILCGPCNTGIGQLGDSAARLESAAAYLRQTQPREATQRQAAMASGRRPESQQLETAPQKPRETQCELWALQKAHG